MKGQKAISLLMACIILICTGCTKTVPEYCEVTTDISVFSGRFYYEQMSEEEQLAYREIYQGMLNGETEICLHSIDPDMANTVMTELIYDFPEMFWADGSGYSTQYEDTLFSEGYTIVEPDYVYVGEERTSREAEIDAEVSAIIQSIPAEYSEYEKIKYVYEYLINSIEYVEDAPDNQNIYSAFVGKETVCAGYARATQYLLNELGIYCAYVMGTATNEDGEDSHAWNIVMCDGDYYYVDVTWADPLYEDEETYQTEILTYDYLCCSEEQLKETHVLEGGYEYPACDSEALNYYRLNDMFYESVDRDELLDKMYESIDASEKAIAFKFSNDDTYEQGKNLIIQELIEPAAQHLLNKQGLAEIEYYYEEDASLNKLTISWLY